MIRRVTGSVKGGVAADLTACTAVVGENRANKTAVLDAIRLALTGRHPIGPHPADLLRLAPEGSLLVVGLDADEGQITFECSPRGRGGSKPKITRTGAFAAWSEEDLGHVLLLDVVSDLLDLGPARGREAIFRRFGATFGFDVPRGLDESAAELWRRATTATQQMSDPAARLAEMAAYFRRAKRAAGEFLHRIEAQIEETSAAGPPPTRDEVAAARARLDAARQFEDAAVRRARCETLRAEVASLMEKATRLDADCLRAKKTRNTDPEVIQQLRTMLDDRRARVARADGILALIGTATERCPACGAQEAETATRLAQMRKEVGAAKVERGREIERITGRLAEVEHARAEDARALAARDAAVVDARRGRAALAEAERAIQDVHDPNVLLAEAEGAWRDVTTRQTQAEAAVALIDRKREAAREVDDLRDLEARAAKVLVDALERVAKVASQAVTRFMPAGYEACLIVDETTARWEVVGRDRRAHPAGAMSGAERAALLVALACAWVEGAPMRLLLLDDRDVGPFDPANFRALLGALAQAVEAGALTQVIVCCSRPSEVPDGWVIVEVKGSQTTVVARRGRTPKATIDADLFD